LNGFKSQNLAFVFQPFTSDFVFSDTIEEEWLAWYRLTPAQRWQESSILWDNYLLMGGSLDDAPDSQSPFNDAELPGPKPADGRPSLHLIRRGGI
jgi:hypothetical protein